MRIVITIGCLAFAVLTINCAPVFGQGQMLVLTAEEFEANLNFRERSANMLDKPAAPDSPKIIVESPNIGADVAPPVNITVRFESYEDSKIDISSLKIHYGWFDITDRIRESMTVTPSGIVGDLTTGRRGQYTLRVTISDDKNRSTTEKIRFTIAELNVRSAAGDE